MSEASSQPQSEATPDQQQTEASDNQARGEGTADKSLIAAPRFAFVASLPRAACLAM